MSDRGRGVVFGLGLILLMPALLLGLRGLPGVGRYHGIYGLTLNRIAVAQRHATDVVTAVNFDYRAFDTVGEEFILFVSVVGVVVLLRQHKEELDDSAAESRDDHEPGRSTPPQSDAVRLLGVGLVGFTVLFGIDIVTHGQLTPGGGFQGGVILATVPLVVYLAADARTFKRIVPHWLVEAAEAVGAAGFAALGVLGLCWGLPYLTNVLPLGKVGSPYSAGLIPLISAATGLEVAGGFSLLLYTFLEETLERLLEERR